MSKVQLVLVVLLPVMVLLAACAPAAVPAPAPAPAPATGPAPQPLAVQAAPSRTAGEIEWGKALAAAKNEGKVVIYFSSGSAARAAIQQGFTAATGVKAEFISGVTAQLAEKVMTEHRVGLRLSDVTFLGATEPITRFKPAGLLDPLDKVLILPEVSDPKAWRAGELPWIDKDHTVIAFISSLTCFLTINTQLVKPEEVKSWRDLLDPKWKKSIVLFGPSLSSGSGVAWAQAMGRFIMGWDYMRELAKQEPIITEDARLQVEWIARGKYPIGAGAREEIVQEFIGIGTPLANILPKEGGATTAGPGAVSLLKGAPHPNAAKVFVNWLLTKEGGIIATGAMGYTSARLDVPVLPHLAARAPPAGAYPSQTSEENLLVKTEDIKILREIFPLNR